MMEEGGKGGGWQGAGGKESGGDGEPGKRIGGKEAGERRTDDNSLLAAEGRSPICRDTCSGYTVISYVEGFFCVRLGLGFKI